MNLKPVGMLQLINISKCYLRVHGLGIEYTI